jgi:hypothetical protein
MGDLHHLTAKDGSRLQQNDIELNVFAFEGSAHPGGTAPNDYHVVLALSHVAVQM